MNKKRTEINKLLKAPRPVQFKIRVDTGFKARLRSFRDMKIHDSQDMSEADTIIYILDAMSLMMHNVKKN